MGSGTSAKDWTKSCVALNSTGSLMANRFAEIMTGSLFCCREILLFVKELRPPSQLYPGGS